MAELGILTTRDVRTVARLLGDAGLVPLSVKGKMKFYDSAKALQAIHRVGESAKERLDNARAELAEMELATRRGELLEASAVLTAQQRRESEIRARMRSVPTAVAAQVAPPSKLRQVEEAIRSAIDDALEELAGVEVGDAVRG